MSEASDIEGCFKSLRNIRWDLLQRNFNELLLPYVVDVVEMNQKILTPLFLQMDISSSLIQGDKPSVTFIARYLFGSKDHTYLEWIGSDGSCVWDSGNSDPMMDFFNDYSK